MPPDNEGEHGEMLRLIRENNALIKENHALVRKLYRHEIIGLWMRILWYAILIGLPFAMYFYLLQPYFEAVGANYEAFRVGMGEIPGLKGFELFFPSKGAE